MTSEKKRISENGKGGGEGGDNQMRKNKRAFFFFFLKHEQLNKDYSFCGTMEGKFKVA